MAEVKGVKPVTDQFKSVWDKQSGLRKTQDRGKWPRIGRMIVRQLMKAGVCLFSVFWHPPNLETDFGTKLL